MDGKALHSQESGVPPEKWCITRKDLIFLRQEIRDAIQSGKIQSTESDPFDSHDNSMGPCMYNVVGSYIKPLTLEAGKMSWALLRHPEGLSCHIFITHCWAEGAFEFIDKVLESWPCKSLKHAWCCIFANPQVLDIGHLIQEPRASPFAVALRCASHMMVVSTKNVSIYSRIWCAYEAHLATSENKIIFIATRPKHRILVKVALATTIIWSVRGQNVTHLWYWWLILFATHFTQCFYNYQSRQSEIVELGNAYTSLLEAEASNPDDKRKILEEIGQNMKEVEESVRRLMVAGISTPYLREAAMKGAETWGCADASFPWMSCYAWANIALRGQGQGIFYPVANTTMLLLTVVQYNRGRLQMGQTAFISSVVTKLALITAALYFVVFLHVSRATSSSAPVDVLVLVMGCLGFAFSLAGMSRIASIPAVGPKLASALGPGWSWLLGACFDTSRMPRAAGFRKTASWIREDLRQSFARRLSKSTLRDQSGISATDPAASGKDIEAGASLETGGGTAETLQVEVSSREDV